MLSTATGFVISLLAWEFVVKPVWNIHTDIAENFQITVFFTVLSIARGYVWRRVGNHFSHKNNKKKSNDQADWNYGESPSR